MPDRFRTRWVFAAILGAAFCLTALQACAEDDNPRARSEKSSADKTRRLFKAAGVIELNAILPPMEITAEDTEGRTVRSRDLLGRIVFLNFWTTWCPDCRAEMPSMEKLNRRFKDRPFTMLGVSLREPAATVREFAKANHLGFVNLLDSDGQIAQAFNVRSIPTTFILDREGRLIGKAVGPRDWESRDAVSLFEHLIGASDNAPEKANP